MIAAFSTPGAVEGQTDVRRATALGVGLGLASLVFEVIGAVVGPNGTAYLGAVIPALTFAMVQLVVPNARIRLHVPLSPMNWATAAFILQLLVIPALILMFGPVPGALPVLPSTTSINFAFALQSMAYVSFVVGASFWSAIPGPSGRSTDGLPDRIESTRRPGSWTVTLFLALGAVGLALRFGSMSAVIDYFLFGSAVLDQRAALEATGSASLALAASSFLLPCLGFGLILAWCQLAELGRSAGRWSLTVVLSMTAVGVAALLAFSLFNYNRGAIAVPVVALAAALSFKIRRIPVPLLFIGALGLLSVALVLGSVRTSYYQSLGDRYRFSQVSLAQIDVNKQMQVYGSGAQFLAFIVDVTSQTGKLYLGQSIVASIMYPVPQLGRDFRPTSGPALYNSAIYGFDGVVDQIIPFGGELYWNFGVPGIVGGFILLGVALAWLDRWFARARSVWSAFMVMYVGVWTSFLIIGGISVVAQIGLYFGWSLVAIVLWNHLRTRSHSSTLTQ